MITSWLYPAALIVWGLAIIVIQLVRGWKAECVTRQAEAICRKTEADNQRATAERLYEQVRRFERLTGAHKSDNLAPLSARGLHLVKSAKVIQLFGKKPSDVPTDGGRA
jgi:hypothetical protein